MKEKILEFILTIILIPAILKLMEIIRLKWHRKVDVYENDIKIDTIDYTLEQLYQEQEQKSAISGRKGYWVEKKANKWQVIKKNK